MILITGASDGIGKQIAIELIKQDFDILLHGRNKEKLFQTKQILESLNKKRNIEIIVADFSSLNEVKKMAKYILENYPQINILINNAGIYQKQLEYSVDGFEMTYAVNFLAHFVLSLSILPLLLKNKPARIINLSSLTHTWAKLDWKNINAESYYRPTDAYSLSKLFNLIFSNELHRRLKGKDICVNALHPGIINTKLLRAGWSGGANVSLGAQTPVYLATKEYSPKDCGKYWDTKQISVCSEDSKNIANGKKLFEIAEQHSGMKWNL